MRYPWILLSAVFLAAHTSWLHAAQAFKVATISPAGSSWMQTMQQAAESIETQTEGRVRIRFFPGGVMGDDATVFRKMRLGQLQGAAIAAGSLAKVYPDSQIYALPMLFDSYEAVDRVRAGMDERIVRGLEEHGLIVFGLGEGGFSYIMSDSPIHEPEDLSDKKVWVPSGDRVSQEIMTSFGISTIPLSMGDVLPSLQTGLIDTVTTSPIGALALQWHTQVKYITDLPVIYIYAVLAIDKRTFERLSPGDRRLFRSEMEAAFQTIDRRNRADNRAALQALQNQGIKFVKPGPEAMKEWRQMARQARQEQIDTGFVSREAYRAVQSYLEARQSTGATSRR